MLVAAPGVAPYRLNKVDRFRARRNGSRRVSDRNRSIQKSRDVSVSGFDVDGLPDASMRWNGSAGPLASSIS